MEMTLEEKIMFDQFLLQSGELTVKGVVFTQLRLERNIRILQAFGGRH